MQAWICQKNIERLRKLMESGRDGDQRTLLKEEEAKLAQLLEKNAEPSKGGRHGGLSLGAHEGTDKGKQ